MVTDYPANYQLDAPEKLANWRPLVHWLLDIPHLLIANVLGNVAASSLSSAGSRSSHRAASGGVGELPVPRDPLPGSRLQLRGVAAGSPIRPWTSR